MNAHTTEPATQDTRRERRGLAAFRTAADVDRVAGGQVATIEPPVAAGALMPGQTLAGRYRLFERIARGGMGWIWSATDETLQREVAIKVMAPGLADDEDFRRRFLQEARTAAAIASPNVVSVFDGGVADGQPYIVLERLEGEDLHARLARAGRLSVAASARILADVARGLAAAHAAGVVHRDIKPPNLFVARSASDDEETVKILDFGVSRQAGASARATITGLLLGSPHFMSPELVRGDADVGPASDLFSLGTVMYRCITGCLPWDGATSDEILDAIERGEHAPPSRHVTGLPPAVDAFFARALARDASARFSSAPAMAQALTRIVEDGAARARGAGARPAAQVKLGAVRVVRAAEGRARSGD